MRSGPWFVDDCRRYGVSDNLNELYRVRFDKKIGTEDEDL